MKLGGNGVPKIFLMIGYQLVLRSHIPNISMRRLFSPIAAFCLLITFYSCQKQSELQPPTPDQEQHGLWRVRITSPGQPKEVQVWEFKYDALARVTTFSSYNVDSNTTTGRPDTTDKAYTAYYYNGTDKLPYKEYSPQSGIWPATTYYYFYDNQGRKILDSNESKNTADQLYWDKVFYAYSSDKVVVTQTGKNPMIGTKYYADTIYTSAQTNISKIVHREETPGNAAFTHLYTYAYDNKKNPFYDLNIKGVTFFAGLWLNYLNLYYGINPNNKTEEIFVDKPGNAPYKTTIAHTYNTEGYPVRSVYTSHYKQVVTEEDTYYFDYK